MNPSYSNFDYQQWRDALSAIDADNSPSELHGIVCGAICSQLNSSQVSDIHEIVGLVTGVGHESNTALAGPIQALYEHSWNILEKGDASFALMLADDEESLERRTDDLAAWCRGYVYGLLQSDALRAEDLPGDAPEIVRDLMAISQAEPGDDPNQDEWALAEVIEYVRAGVQLIFAELRAKVAGKNPH